MQDKYTPLRFEMQTVETLRYLPDDPDKLAQVILSYEAKYATDIIVEKHSIVEREWSWRSDCHYETTRTEYRIRCLRPVYSEADQLTMADEAREEALKQFRDKYANVLKRQD